MRRTMNLGVDHPRAAVVAIDLHRGHLDMAVATMPTTPEVSTCIIAANKRLFDRCPPPHTPPPPPPTTHPHPHQTPPPPLPPTRPPDPTPPPHTAIPPTTTTRPR